MNRVLIATLATVCLSNAALADEKLAGAKNCLGCHAVGTQVLGPSFKEVAKKYAGNAAAVAQLATKIQQGGAGVWGAIPMPANPTVNDADAKKLAQWVLGMK